AMLLQLAEHYHRMIGGLRVHLSLIEQIAGYNHEVDLPSDRMALKYLAPCPKEVQGPIGQIIPPYAQMNVGYVKESRHPIFLPHTFLLTARVGFVILDLDPANFWVRSPTSDAARVPTAWNSIIQGGSHLANRYPAKSQIVVYFETSEHNIREYRDESGKSAVE